jgi:hypothetical protein
MSTADLEKELARWRDPEARTAPSNALPLTIADALAYRDAGNLPDDHDRTLRLVLIARSLEEVRALGRKRALFEPDYHEAPVWRRDGSAPVNVVPLRAPGVTGDPSPWWEDADVAGLEREWQATGRIAGLAVPGEYRGFVFKTIVSLREAGLPVTEDSVADSISRWLPPEQADEIRAALTGRSERAGPG